MSNILRKLKVIEDITIELPISKSDFINKFRANVEYSNLSFSPFEGFEAFTSSKFEYKGNCNEQGFEIKKRRKLFDTNYSFARAKGTFKESFDKLIITTEINAFRKKMYFFLGFILLFDFFIISTAVFAKSNELALFLVPFILIHASLMIGIPYFIMRRSVKRMNFDLERDFHYWVTKN
jgi:hypothetical protein